MFDDKGNPWLLEANCAPGINKISAGDHAAIRLYHHELLPGVLSTFGVPRENEESPRAAAFAAELRRCMVGQPFDGGRLRMCAQGEGAECISAEDEQALWLAFDELCTAEARGFMPAFPRPGATGFHIGTPPRIDRLLWLWQERCRGPELCDGPTGASG